MGAVQPLFVNDVVAKTTTLTSGSGNFKVPPYNTLTIKVWGPGGGAGGGGVGLAVK